MASQSSALHWTRLLAVCIALAAAVWFVFGQTLQHKFVNYDDDTYVYDNPVVKSGLTIEGIRWSFTSIHSSNWHPLTTLSHMLDCELYGLNPGGHHFTNVLIHSAAAILLFLVLRCMTAAFWPSAFVAAVFAIHPLHVESVAWVAERKDLLSGLFFVLTLGAYTSYVQRPSIPRYLLVAFLFACGLMSKPMLVTLPFVLLLLDYWPFSRVNAAADRRIFLRLILEKIPLLALAAVSSTITFFAQGKAVQPLAHIDLPLRLSNALVSYGDYLRQTFFPAGLTVFYPFPTEGVAAWKLMLSIVVLVVISSAALLRHKKHPYLLVGWLWFLGMLVPVIGIVQVGSQARADRYMYLPQIGLAIAVAWMARDIFSPGRRWLLGPVAALVLAGLMIPARIQTAHWRNSGTLWRHTIANISEHPFPHNNLANFYLETDRPDKAIQHYQKAIELRPDLAEPHYGLGNAFLKLGRTNDAIAQYYKAIEIFARTGRTDQAVMEWQMALRLRPDAHLHNELAVLLSKTGRTDEAISHFQKAIEIHPQFADAHSNFGILLARRDRLDEAAAHLKKALEIQPDHAGAHINLAIVFTKSGRIDEALSQWEKAIALDPEALAALNNVAWLLATASDERSRDAATALKLARLGERIADDNPLLLRTLAAAFAANGQFAEAIEAAERALARAQGNDVLATAIRAELEQYRSSL